jgi:hypothetical protein
VPVSSGEKANRRGGEWLRERFHDECDGQEVRPKQGSIAHEPRIAAYGETALELLGEIIEENKELRRIFTSSLKTARANKR